MTQKRRKIYYAANQISETRFAKPGEFITKKTLKPYIGEYVIADGTLLTGARPTPDSLVLIQADGPAGTKFLSDNGLKYFELTRKEFTNHTTPQLYFPEPDEEIYLDGQFQRYFAQKKNEPGKIVEIDEEQFKTANASNKIGLNKKLWSVFEIQWAVTGKDATLINTQNVANANVSYEGIQDYLVDVTQYVKTTIGITGNYLERKYPDGKLIKPNLPASYGTSEKTNQACSNCTFRGNNFCSKWQANIRNQYWCLSWREYSLQEKFAAKSSNNY
jgi:hypothetical protein